MKKLTIIFLTIILSIFAFTFTGCAEKNEYGHEVYPVIDKVTFVKVIDGEYCDIFVHKETRVMYVKYSDCGMSVMLNKDGKPLLWNGNV